MATNKLLDNKLRSQYMEKCKKFLADNGEEILITGSNEICMPCVDADGNDKFIVLTFKVPTGSRDGELYDGYAIAEDYELKVKANEEKAKEKAQAKARKIAKDKAEREARAKLKAEKQTRNKRE